MADKIYDRLSPESRMRLDGMDAFNGWLRNTLVRCKEDTIGQSENAAWTLRKVIDRMENQGAIDGLKKLLAELEEIDRDDNN
jgi:hypothetical protein